VTGQQLTVGPPFYEQATGPLWAALLALMGIAPLSAWGYSTLKTIGPRGVEAAIPTLLSAGGLVCLRMSVIGFAFTRLHTLGVGYFHYAL